MESLKNAESVKKLYTHFKKEKTCVKIVFATVIQFNFEK